MAAESVRDLITRLIFKVDKRSQSTAERAGEATKQAAVKASEGWTTFTARIGLAIAGLQAIGRVAKRVFTTIIGGFITTADAIAKTSRAIGVNADEFQRLSFAVQIHGGTQKALEVGLKTLTKRMRDASLGLKTQKEAFAEVGISVDQLRGKDAGQVFRMIAKGMERVPTQARRAALAQELLGKKGIALTNTLNAGGAELDRLGKRFEALGGLIDKSGRERAEKAADAFLELKTAATGFRNRIATALLPSLTALVERFTNFIGDGDRVTRMLETVRLGAQLLGSVLATLAARQLVGVVAGFARYVVGLFAVDAANKKTAISTRILSGALGLLKATGILLIAAALQDLFKLATGKESEIAKALGPAGAEDLKRVVLELGGILKGLLKELAPALADLLKAIAPLIPPLAKVLAFLGRVAAVIAKAIVVGLRLVMRLFRSIGVVAGDIASGIKSAWDGTIGAVIDQIGDWISALGGVKRIGELILVPFEAIKDAIQFVIDKIRTVVKGAAGVAKAARGFVGGTIGGVDVDVEKLKRELTLQTKGFQPPTGAGFGPAAAMGGRAGAGTVVNQANQSANTFNISGAGDPKAIAAEVEAKLTAKNQENQDAQMRQVLANLRGG